MSTNFDNGNQSFMVFLKMSKKIGSKGHSTNGGHPLGYVCLLSSNINFVNMSFGHTLGSRPIKYWVIQSYWASNFLDSKIRDLNQYLAQLSYNPLSFYFTFSIERDLSFKLSLSSNVDVE